MKKIPTLFARGEDGLAIPKVTAGCEWVGDEGVPQVATRKYDGTCVSVTPDGAWWSRREVKPGKDAPPCYVLVERDENTGKSFGWEPIEQSSHYKAFKTVANVPLPHPDDRVTYELCGPKVNGNPENRPHHELIRHGALHVFNAPTDFDDLRFFLERFVGEGLVWWAYDGRKAKIKRRDFGWGT